MYKSADADFSEVLLNSERKQEHEIRDAHCPKLGGHKVGLHRGPRLSRRCTILIYL